MSWIWSEIHGPVLCCPDLALQHPDTLNPVVPCRKDMLQFQPVLWLSSILRGFSYRRLSA